MTTSNFLKDKINEMHERISKSEYKKETPDGVILGDPSAKNGVTFKLPEDFIYTKSDIKPTKNEESLGKINAEAKVPHPLMLDEVSASFISYIRTNFWEKLGKEYGGYKIGRILSFILCVLNEKIEDSTAATIKVDVPQYEQLNKVSCNCGGDCKCHKEEPDEERFCMYCKEADGTINHDDFTEVVDVELGAGWLCKECFLESCKEEREHHLETEKELIQATESLEEIKKLVCNPAGAKTEMELMKNQHERLNKIYKLACEGLGEEVSECQ
jgi:hypothetical protein